MAATIDPMTLEVIRNRIENIANEVQFSVLRSSHSIVVREASDASVSIFDISGQQIAQAAGIPIHLGVVIPTVARILEAFPADQMANGDAYLMNDPFGPGPSHLPDLVVVAPLVVGGRPIALVVVLTHHQDIGGRSPGGMPPDATEIYQEGLRLPPLKLADGGVENPTLIKVIRSNVRVPDAVIGDLRGQLAGCQLGCNRLTELIDRYTPEVVIAAMSRILDQSEAMARAVIRSIPDGAYGFTDYLDHDGFNLDRMVRIQTTVTVADSDITIDMSGSDMQVAGPTNAVAGATASGVYYLMKSLGGPDIPNNAGYYRPIHIVLPPGTVVNAQEPAAVSSYSLIVFRTVDCLTGALGQAIPDRMPAASHGHSVGLSLAYGSTIAPVGAAGGMGARPTKDGVDSISFGPGNAGNVPLEVLESRLPVLFDYYRLRVDSGGAGRFRGGLGTEEAFTVRNATVTVSQRLERHLTAPWGVHGGKSGMESRSALKHPDGPAVQMPTKSRFPVGPGDTFEFCTTGGGGYGDPLDRSIELVERDLLNGKVSPERANDLYGVVVVEGIIDVARTARRRTDLRAMG